MDSKFPIADLLLRPFYLLLFFLVFSGVFYLNYYAMAYLPGERDLMCVMGGGLTFVNVLFGLAMATLAGLVIVGLVENVRNKSKTGQVKVTGASAVGLILGSLTTFCTLCTIPVISLFGLSIGLGVFTRYEVIFKVVSLALLSLALYYANQELRKGCARCVV